MKKIITLLFISSIAGYSAMAQEAESTSGAEITFEKEVHDFGTLKQNGDATTEFKFTNTGTEPLIISNAKGSCGCTVPEWPREPIAPGESGVIRVKYDSKRLGPINKSVTITSNASNGKTKVLRIKGNIEAAPKADESVPAKEPATAAPKAN
ncbi:MAG: hypothetical protein Kow0075_07820 [Salibacteraceae bacterium]